MSENRDRPQARMSPIDPANAGLPKRPTQDAAAVELAMGWAMDHGFNLLGPLTTISHIPNGYAMAFRVVAFPVKDGWDQYNKSNGTWYRTDGGDLALHKASLRMLAAAAGMSWETARTDDRREPNRWEFMARARVRSMDGVWRTITATKDLDLRDVGPIVADMKATATKAKRDPTSQILKARAAGSRMAESKAVNAAIRSALGLRGAYSRDAASKPFMFPTLVWLAEGPEARKLQAAVELGVVERVYGPANVTEVLDVEADTVHPSQGQRQLPAPNDIPTDMDRLQEDQERRRQREPVRRGDQERGRGAPQERPRRRQPEPEPDTGRWGGQGGGFHDDDDPEWSR